MRRQKKIQKRGNNKEVNGKLGKAEENREEQVGQNGGD